jgi:hypothetical protein
MKKFFTTVIGLAMLGIPAVAAADLGEVTLPMMLNRQAFIQAESSGMQIGCAMSVSTAAARVGEAFTVAWGSYGAYASSQSLKTAWAPSGLEIIRVQKPGTYEYKFQFAGPGGVATCLQRVTVS